jgi:hypothetical protein
VIVGRGLRVELTCNAEVIRGILNEADHEAAGRQPSPEDGGGVERQQPSMQDGHAVGKLLRLVQIVSRDQDRAARVASRFEQRAHLAADLRVQSGRRLVEQEDIRPVKDRTCDRHLLSHALGELGSPRCCVTGKPKGLEQPVDLESAAIDFIQAGIDEQVLAHAQPIPQARRLRQEADAAAQCRSRRPGKAHAPDRHHAGGGPNQSGQHPHRCRLARPVWTEERNDLRRAHLERDIVDGDAPAEPSGEMGGGDHRCRVAPA